MWRDSEHEIISDIQLKANGVLHRFENEGGVPCSAIYVDGIEVWWHYREHEKRMVRDWNDYGYKNYEE